MLLDIIRSGMILTCMLPHIQENLMCCSIGCWYIGNWNIFPQKYQMTEALCEYVYSRIIQRDKMRFFYCGKYNQILTLNSIYGCGTVLFLDPINLVDTFGPLPHLNVLKLFVESLLFYHISKYQIVYKIYFRTGFCHQK